MINNLKEEKKSLRKKILAIRDGMSPDEVRSLSEQATKNIIQSEIFKNAEHIMIFSSFRSEIRTEEIIEEILRTNKKLYMPLSMLNTFEIVCCRIHDRSALREGEYGILEPAPEDIFIGDYSDLDLVVVPGAAFDLHGNRIGYGAGYYDRFLSRPYRKATAMGLCFGLQVVDSVPSSELDTPLDYLVNEKGVFKVEK